MLFRSLFGVNVADFVEQLERHRLSPRKPPLKFGRDSFENAGASGDQKKLLQGLLPLGVSNKTLTGNSLTDRHGDAWWAGFTTELKVLDPFRFALDATYGRVDLGEGLSTKGKKIDVKREGWIVSALAEYKMESVTPGLTRSEEHTSELQSH